MTEENTDPLGDAEGDEARLAIEKDMVSDTDNSVRDDDGEQPTFEFH